MDRRAVYFVESFGIEYDISSIPLAFGLVKRTNLWVAQAVWKW